MGTVAEEDRELGRERCSDHESLGIGRSAHESPSSLRENPQGAVKRRVDDSADSATPRRGGTLTCSFASVSLTGYRRRASELRWERPAGKGFFASKVEYDE